MNNKYQLSKYLLYVLLFLEVISLTFSNYIYFYIISYIFLFVFLLFYKYNHNNYLIFFHIFLQTIVLPTSIKHIYGNDVHMEYYVYSNTIINNKWSLYSNTIIDGCINISILPSVINLVINLPNEYFFIYFYSIIMNLIILFIYIIIKNTFHKDLGILVIILYSCQKEFLYAVTNPRTNIAIVFVIIFLYVLLFKQKIFLVILVLFNVTISHYATALSLYFIIIVYYIYTYIFIKRTNIPIKFIIIFSIILYLWYNIGVSSIFINIFIFIEQCMLDYFSLNQNLTDVTYLIGYNIQALTYIQILEFIISWIIIGSIIAELILTLYNKLFNHQKFKNMHEHELYILSCINVFILSLFIFISYLSLKYSYSRMFLLSSTMLLVYVVLFIKRIFNKKYIYIFYTLVICYSLISTGMLYQLNGNYKSVIFSKTGTESNYYYIYDVDTKAILWMKQNFNNKFTADYYSRAYIISQGTINISNITLLSSPNYDYSLLYLRNQNILSETIDLGVNNKISITLIDFKNLIYNNNAKILFNNN